MNLVLSDRLTGRQTDKALIGMGRCCAFNVVHRDVSNRNHPDAVVCAYGSDFRQHELDKSRTRCFSTNKTSLLSCSEVETDRYGRGALFANNLKKEKQ